MSTFIIKINNLYMEWSTVVDDVVSKPMPIDEFKAYYRKQYGNTSMLDLVGRLARVEEWGTSSVYNQSLRDLARYNRSGENEKRLTFRAFKEKYGESHV